ncbi:MAG: hypothetical protein JW800_05705 [Candidatus Omnitrophica bacterium]|nr:hypothetical protein [Candidatus Omnitrophota bacterium]
MKRHSYAEIIGMSWKWTVELLFRPFNFKKWVMLAIIVILAGQMGGNFNFNSRMDNTELEKIKSALGAKGVSLPSGISQEALPSEEKVFGEVAFRREDISAKIAAFFKDRSNVLIFTAVVSSIIILMAFFVLLWMWVQSNFSFVLIDSIVRNDASLRIPFHRNKTQGGSYFKWQICISAIFWMFLGVIVAMAIIGLKNAGIFSGPKPIEAGKILSIILPCAPLLAILLALAVIIAFFTHNFVLPIMYKKKIGILKAWAEFLGVAKGHIVDIFLYILVKAGLSILALGIMAAIAILGILVFILIAGILVLIGMAINAVLPVAVKPVLLAVLIIIAVPALIALGLLFNMLFLPIPIFFRIFSINTLASFDETLDIFAAKTPEELKEEEDDSKYMKSMRLVWFTVLLPVIIAFLALILSIAIPNLLRSRNKVIRGIRPKVNAIKRISEEGQPAANEGIMKPSVKVYLKNGNMFEATVSSESEDNIEFQIEGGRFVLPRADILRIE